MEQTCSCFHLDAFYTNLTYIEHEEGVRSKWISGYLFHSNTPQDWPSKMGYSIVKLRRA